MRILGRRDFLRILERWDFLRNRERSPDPLASADNSDQLSSRSSSNHLSRVSSSKLPDLNRKIDTKGQESSTRTIPLSARVLAAFLASFFVATILIRSAILAFPYALMVAGAPLVLQRRRKEKERAELRSLWPEILDHIISGLRSGLSLSETLSNLGRRGPEISKPIFLEFESQLRSGMDFEGALVGVKNYFHDPMADQVCEVLKFARGSGNRDTTHILRTLADFIRTDLDLRNEIAAKHGWIKNSATLAALAPWVLLLILALQPNTLKAYTSSAGVLILGLGVLLTVVAYIWMNYVGRIPESPRVFTQ